MIALAWAALAFGWWAFGFAGGVGLWWLAATALNWIERRKSNAESGAGAMKDVSLDHETPECIGLWKLWGPRASGTIYCTCCTVRYEATPENRLAMIEENFAGVYLRHLTDDGVGILEAERAS